MTQRDILDCVKLTLDAIKANRLSDEAAECSEQNAHLETSLLNYLALLRRRPLTSTYEFLTPPADDGRRAGWYWRHPKSDWREYVNWHGPFASRKLAVENRIALAPRTRSEFLVAQAEADIFA